MIATQANGDSLWGSSFLLLLISVQNGYNVHSTLNHTTGHNLRLYDLYCSGSLGEWLGMYNTKCDDARTYVQ